ncbi:MAG: ferrous iron transport protein B [Turneriella sp.]
MTAPDSATTTLRVALIGNPNAGKTTVFNALCGTRQQTGNYAGVTVEKKTGSLRGYEHIEIIDLPGTYSLQPKSADEEITERVLSDHAGKEKVPDLAIAVLDASNLKRSLYLCLQVIETGLPVIAVVTMSDIAARRGLSIDIAKLSKQLGIPVYPVTLATKEQVADLTAAIATHPHPLSPSPKGRRGKSNSLRSVAEGLGMKVSIEDRYAAIDKILRGVLKKERAANTLTQKIDALLTHRLLGLVAFAVIIGAMFFSIYAGARPVMDLIDNAMKMLAASLRGTLSAYPVTASLVADGIIAGAGSVFVFLPQIMILFLCISILEETGYLARAAFLMDKLLGWTGLNGRAFIPLLSSFACAVPGILSARVMPTDRARMATILIAPLMSCSARLPVYVLFIGAFIEPRFGALWAGICLFAMHLVGISVAMPLAYLLNRKILKTGESPFLLELPEYHMPHWPNVWRRVYDAAMNFLKRVGGIIFALSIVIWALAYFPHSSKTTEAELALFAKTNAMRNEAALSLLTHVPKDKSGEEKKAELESKLRAAHLRDSLLGRFGRAVEPAFSPLGFDWKISVAILAAFPAREVFVSTLGIIFSVADTKDDPAALGKKLTHEKKPSGEAAYGVLLSISIMIFFALCAQCMSTLATIRRELMSTGWAVTVFFALTSLAYLASLAVYQIGKRLT